MESLSPFLWGSCIPYNMPVYPGARRETPKPVLLKNSSLAVSIILISSP